MAILNQVDDPTDVFGGMIEVHDAWQRVGLTDRVAPKLTCS
jgi:hypothetical protein